MKISLDLNEAQAKLLDDLVRLGIYGATREDACKRIIDRFFQERIRDARK